MKKIKFLVKRIFQMNYKEMFNTINRMSKKSKKSKIYLFFSVIYCGIKHGAGYVDYEYYKMYDLNEKQRSTIMTRGRSNHYVSMLNPKEYWHIFNNKNEFNEKFDKYLNRDWMYLNENNFDDFKTFCKKHTTIIVKPNDLSCGKGVSKIDTSKLDIKKLYKECMENKTYLIEEVAIQNKLMNKLHKESVNTVRVVTLISDSGKPYVITAVVRIGSGNAVVDNFNAGGVTAMIDLDTGKICSPAINSNGKIFDKHPTTNVKLVGYQIPMWKEIKKLVLETAMVVKEMRLIGWDVCVGEDKPIIIEGNQFPSHDLYQPLFGINGSTEGVVPIFEEVIHKKEK